MSPERALLLLYSTTEQSTLTKKQHVECEQAYAVLHQALANLTKQESKEPK